MQSRLHRYLGRCKSTLVHRWLTTPGWLLYLAAVEFLKSGDGLRILAAMVKFKLKGY